MQWLVFGSFVSLIINIPMLLAGNVEVRVLLPFTSLIFMLIDVFTNNHAWAIFPQRPIKGSGKQVKMLYGLAASVLSSMAYSAG